VLGETPEAFVHAFPRALLGVTPQGWMRSLGSKLPSVVTYRRWDPSPQCLSRIDALILSIEDIEGDESLARAYARHCNLVVVTRGAQGATLFQKSEPYHVAAFPAHEHDPTGAGDVFAAALLVRLYETDNPFEAAHFASGAAARSVERSGAARIPTRPELEAFLNHS
jgi:sugar/nucleoside kinase (ribokinase family)